jgi:hypothetical protein
MDTHESEFTPRNGIFEALSNPRMLKARHPAHHPREKIALVAADQEWPVSQGGEAVPASHSLAG